MAPNPDGSDSCGNKIVIHFPGGGLFYWWQHGALMSLRSMVDLSDEVVLTLGVQRFVFTGASCGSLCAAMAACNIDIKDSMKVAHSLVERENSESIAAGLGTWMMFRTRARKRPWRALPFKWKMLLKEWLEVLLPSNAHKLCSGRLHVQCQRVFPLPTMEVISEFRSKPDLISVLLASCHIPFFMDSNLSTTLRGKQFYIDGAIGRGRDSIGVEGLEAHISLDPREDPELFKDKFTSSVHYAGIQSLTKLVDKGKTYVLGYKRAQYYLDPANKYKTLIPPFCYQGHIAEGGNNLSRYEQSRSVELTSSDYIWV